jgi:hypothetical protein
MNSLQVLQELQIGGTRAILPGKKPDLMTRRLPVALIAAIVAIWTALAGISPAANAEPAFPPGLRIGLEPQAGLTLSNRFPGFEDPDHKVAITILDLPGQTYEAVERSAFAKEQQNLGDVKRESFPFASGIGFLIGGRSTVNGVVLNKWFLLASAYGKDLTALINVEVPESARAIYTDAIIRKMLASVTFRPPPIQEQLGLLPFKLDDMAGFRVMQVLPGGGMILTDGPSNDINKQPYMIVSVGPGGPTDTDERGKFARELLSSAPLRDLAVTGADAMRIGGLQGFEIRAQARGLDGNPVSLVQWVRFGSGGFLRIIGVSHADVWDALFTRFRAVRDGIEMR